MEFTKTERGQRKTMKDGYMYVFQKNLANDIASWECVLTRKSQCKARIKLIINDQFVEQVNEHTHPPSATACELAKIKAAVKRKAETISMIRTDKCWHQNLVASHLQLL